MVHDELVALVREKEELLRRLRAINHALLRTPKDKELEQDRINCLEELELLSS